MADIATLHGSTFGTCGKIILCHRVIYAYRTMLTNNDDRKVYSIPSQYQFKTPIEVFEQTEKDFLQPRIVMSMFCALMFNFKWASDKEFDDYANTMASKFTKGMVADPKNVKPEEGGAGGYSHGFSNYYGNISDVRGK